MNKLEVTIRNLERLTEVGTDLSNFVSGKQAETWKEEYASHIFTKILMHVISIQRLLPSSSLFSQSSELRFVDISSIATLSRAAIDAYLNMFYLCIDAVSEQESEFRKILWDYHAEYKRYLSLKMIDGNKVAIESVKTESDRLLFQITQSNLYSKLPSDKRKEIRKGNLGVLLTNSRICERASISQNYYKAVFAYLSSYVHTYALALSQLSSMSSDAEAVHRLTNTILDFVYGFFLKSIRDFGSLFHDAFEIVNTCKDQIEHWDFIHKNLFGEVSA